MGKNPEGKFDPGFIICFLLVHDSLTGLEVNAQLVDIFTLIFFLTALIASVYVNIQDWRIRSHRLTKGEIK